MRYGGGGGQIGSVWVLGHIWSSQLGSGGFLASDRNTDIDKNFGKQTPDRSLMNDRENSHSLGIVYIPSPVSGLLKANQFSNKFFLPFLSMVK